MKRSLVISLMLAVFAIAANAQAVDSGKEQTVENFVFSDLKGKPTMLNDLKGSKGTLVVFVSVQCPVVAAYNERINRLAGDYAAKGINVVGVYPNATESPLAISAHAASNYKFTTVIDKDAVVANKLGASVTPEVYYLNEKNALLYKGAIDNSRNGDNITSEHVRTALDEGLAGKPLTKRSSNAFGCSIKRAE